MRATARVEVARCGGRDVVVDARSEPPLSVRLTPDRVLIVGSAAAPVGGDALAVEVTVGAGARLALGTAAATLVWPGAGGAPSSQACRARVDEGGHLDWRPEPMVVVAGSVHRSRVDVELAGAATARVLDEVSLGRSGELPGRLDLELRVTRGGAVLVHHAEHLGPGVPDWASAAHVGGHRHLITGVVVGPPSGAPIAVVEQGAAAARLPLAADAAMLLVAAADRPAALAALARVTGPPSCRPDQDGEVASARQPPCCRA